MIQTVITVVSGVLVFILGELFIEFIMKPIQEFKDIRARISWALVYYANIYCNPQDTTKPLEAYDVASEKLRMLAADLGAFVIRKPKLLKLFYNDKKILEAKSELIGLSNSVYKSSSSEHIYDFIEERRKKIISNLNLRCDI